MFEINKPAFPNKAMYQAEKIPKENKFCSTLIRNFRVHKQAVRVINLFDRTENSVFYQKEKTSQHFFINARMMKNILATTNK